MKRCLFVFTVVLAVIFIAGNSFSATYDATGTWTVITSNFWIDQGNSGDCTGDTPETKTVTINQSGDTFTLTMDGRSYPGTVSGVTYSGGTSYSESGGTTTEAVVVILTSESSGSGTGEWYWTDGTWWCEGGYDISITKGGSGGGGGGGGGDGGGCFIEQLFVNP